MNKQPDMLIRVYRFIMNTCRKTICDKTISTCKHNNAINMQEYVYFKHFRS